MTDTDIMRHDDDGYGGAITTRPPVMLRPEMTGSDKRARRTVAYREVQRARDELGTIYSGWRDLCGLTWDEYDAARDRAERNLIECLTCYDSLCH